MKFLLTILTILLATLDPAQAAITINAASAPSGWKTGTGATTINFSPAFSFTPGTNGMLIVTVSGELTPTNPSVTYNGSPMTRAVGSNQTGSGNNGSYASVWYLANPTVGNGTLVVTTGGSVSRYNVYAIYATGVAQGAPQASLGASFVSQLVFETGFITPTAGALALTVLGGSVSGTGNSYSSSIHTSAGALTGQTPLPQPPTDNSIAAASYRILADGTQIKGRGTQSSTTAGQPESVVIASFAPAPPVGGDSDGDGLADAVETNTGVWVSSTNTGTSPTKADTDGDGLKDALETNTGVYVSASNTGTSPHVADTDGDGAGDWYEVVASYTSPLDAAGKPNIPYPLPRPDGAVGVATKPVKVFIMMGQSNMFGQGEVNPINTPGTLETIVKLEGKFPNLLNDSGTWTVRNDVTYKGLIPTTYAGPLKVGDGGGGTLIGPELGFGHTMGYYLDEPVLLIKFSQGGKSLGYDYLPPGSQQYTSGTTVYAGYGEAPASGDVTNPPTATTATPRAGHLYDLAVSQINGFLSNFNTLYPSYAAQGYEIAGFLWFHGHADTNFTVPYASRYEANLVNFIKSIRKDLAVPTKTPFVVATIGFDGAAASGNTLAVINAQLAMNDASKYPEFVGNVKAIDSRGYWRPLEQSPVSDRAHYHHNAETYMLVGDASGRAMIDLISLNLGLHHYEVAVPSLPVAGVVFNITITAKSVTNVTVNDSTTVVTLSSSTAGSLMEFDWNGDGIYGDNSGTLVAGVKTIKARNKAAQTETIIATAGEVGTIAPPNLTTSPGAFTKLQILAPGEVAKPGSAAGKSGIPRFQYRGVPFNAIVNAVDNNWNRVSNTHTIRITSNDGTAILPANAPLSAGTRTFPITLNASGNFTLTAVNVTDGTKTSNTTPAITVLNDEIPGVNVYGSVPGLNPSNKYSVRVCAASDNLSWHPAFVMQTICMTGDRYFAALANWSHSYVNFEMSVPVVVEITSLTGPINSAVVHPARKSGGVRIVNDKAYVTLNDPCNVHVDINGQMDDNDTGYLKSRGKAWDKAPIHTLSIHANPELAGKPSLTDPNCFYVAPGTTPPTTGAWTTLYFLPGVHNIGVGYLLQKNHQYYIPGDAFVTGAFYSGAWGNGTNIRIFGHGTLSMAGIPHPEHAIPEPTVPHNPIIISGAFNTSVEGITIADPAYHALQMPTSYDPKTYTLSNWVKIFGWRGNGDGINPFGNGRISNCFIRTQDDSSYVQGAGMNDNVFWNDANGSTFVFNSVSAVTNPRLLIENCDVIYSRAAWINWSGGRVFNMRGENGGAGGTGIEFRNINISDPRPTMQTFFLCMETFSPYDNTPQSRTPGHLSGVKFTNVSIAARNPNNEPETLWGSSSGVASIQNLKFDNLQVGGVTVLADIFKKNAYVSGLVFTDSTPVLSTDIAYEAGRAKFSVLNNGSYVGTPGGGAPSIYNVINNGLYKVEASSSLGDPTAWLRVHTSTAPFEFSEMTVLPRYYRVLKP